MTHISFADGDRVDRGDAAALESFDIERREQIAELVVEIGYGLRHCL